MVRLRRNKLRHFASPVLCWQKGNFARPQNCLFALESFVVIGLRRSWRQARQPAGHDIILGCSRRDVDEPGAEIASPAFCLTMGGIAMTEGRARTLERLL